MYIMMFQVELKCKITYFIYAFNKLKFTSRKEKFIKILFLLWIKKKLLSHLADIFRTTYNTNQVNITREGHGTEIYKGAKSLMIMFS